MTRCLVLVLGDQRDASAAVFDDFDAGRDAIRMAEVDEEFHMFGRARRTAPFCPRGQLRLKFFYREMRRRALFRTRSRRRFRPGQPPFRQPSRTVRLFCVAGGAGACVRCSAGTFHCGASSRVWLLARCDVAGRTVATHGHIDGDRVLTDVGHALKRRARRAVSASVA